MYMPCPYFYLTGCTLAALATSGIYSYKYVTNYTMTVLAQLRDVRSLYKAAR